VVDTEDLVVDNAVDQVERAPADEQHADVSPPRRCQADGERDADEDQHPRRRVEEAVGERVRLAAPRVS
jgi:hypothetical protein